MTNMIEIFNQTHETEKGRKTWVRIKIIIEWKNGEFPNNSLLKNITLIVKECLVT